MIWNVSDVGVREQLGRLYLWNPCLEMPPMIWNVSDVGVREQLRGMYLWNLGGMGVPAACLRRPALCLQSLQAELPEESVAEKATFDSTVDKVSHHPGDTPPHST